MLMIPKQLKDFSKTYSQYFSIKRFNQIALQIWGKVENKPKFLKTIINIIYFFIL